MNRRGGLAGYLAELRHADGLSLRKAKRRLAFTVWRLSSPGLNKLRKAGLLR